MLRSDSAEENRVVIRYWPSSTSYFSFTFTGSWLSFGHVSLQTYIGGPNNQGHYVSFWRADIDHRCCGKQQDHFHTREEDVQYCGAAQVKNTFTLYSLDVVAINKAYEDILLHGLAWDLSASMKPTTTKNIDKANCTTLVYTLLQHGKLNQLLEGENRHLLGTRHSLFASALCGIPISAGSVSYITQLATFAVKTKIKTITKTLSGWSVTDDVVYIINNQLSLGYLPRLFISTQKMLGTYGALCAWSAAVIGAVALTGYAIQVSSNCLATTPSDLQRYLVRAQEIERNAYRRLNLFHQQRVSNHPQPVANLTNSRPAP